MQSAALVVTSVVIPQGVASADETYADIGDYDSSTPTFEIYEGDTWKFTGRTDNYASDATGNRWAASTPLVNGNAYVFSGTYDDLINQEEEVTSNYTLEAYLVGKSVIVIFGNGSFISASRVAVDSIENCSVKLIVDHCKFSDISVTDESRYTETLDDITSSAYLAAKSKKIEVTDKVDIPLWRSRLSGVA